jgi:hypothetical protein
MSMVPFRQGRGERRAVKYETGAKYQMGTVRLGAQPAPFYLYEGHLAAHSCVLGQTGSGKSKFLEQLCRYLMASKRGFCLVDPHGDFAEDLLAFAAYRNAEKGDGGIFRRLHYLEPSFEQVFHYDPFKFPNREGIPGHLQDGYIASWVSTKAHRVGEVVQREPVPSFRTTGGRTIAIVSATRFGHHTAV